MKFKEKVRLIVDHPTIMGARLKGFKPIYADHCLTVKDFIKDVRTVIDIGANRGDFAKTVRHFFPRAKIYAFEPIKHYCNKIRDEIKGVEVFNVGLWDKEGEAWFNYNKSADRRSSFLDSGFNNGGSKVEKIKVKQKKLDSVKMDLKKPCYCKIDVEGAELQVLKGMTDTLRKVDVLQVEVNFQDNYKGQSSWNKILELTEKVGFIGFLQGNVRHERGIPTRCDLFFFRDNTFNKKKFQRI